MSSRKSLFTELANLSPSKQLTEKEGDTKVTPVTTPVNTPASTGATQAVSTPAATPVNSPVDTGVAQAAITPVTTPINTGVTTPETSPVSTGIDTPVLQPVTTPATTPVETGVNQPPKWGQTLDSTHTLAEGKVYSIMYRETISKGIDTKRFSIPWLMTTCGIRADSTVRRALRGLAAKYSIEVVSKIQGDRYGPLYRVFGPKDILARRKKMGIEIDPVTKQITPVATGVTPVNPPADSPETTGVHDTGVTPVRNAGHDKYHVNTFGLNESSSVPTNDDEKLSQVRELFNRIAGGGNWKEERDLKSFSEISHVPTWHIILGLCYSVGKSPEHKMSSLAYAVPSILDHYRDMNIFPQSEMVEIAYRTMRKTLLALQTGKWTIPDWESGKEYI